MKSLKYFQIKHKQRRLTKKQSPWPKKTKKDLIRGWAKRRSKQPVSLPKVDFLEKPDDFP